MVLAGHSFVIEITLVMFSLLLSNTAMSCPTNCTCKWKGGKQSVECVSKNYLALPTGIDSGTQVLDFSGNSIGLLDVEQFQKLGLVNLQKIFLSRCRIGKVDERAFRGLSNLVDLDMSSNAISNIPSDVFGDLPSLMKLNLNSNPIKIIQTNAFKNLKYLVTLELSNCQLEVIEKDAFYGLGALELLKLDYNSLKYIPGPKTIPQRLHEIHLEHNPWFCDCQLTDLYSWLNLTSLSHATEPVCDAPKRLRGAPIKRLDEQELACPPDISPTSFFLDVPQDNNVTLVCRVNAIPQARISWYFQGDHLQNDSIMAPTGMHIYYYIEEDTGTKKSELFIMNTNLEHNGTFTCVAENQAGSVQSNYTIKIALKGYNPETGSTSRKLPQEYVIAVCIAAASLFVIIFTCALSCCLQRRRKTSKKRRKNKEKNKASAAVLYGSESQNSTITRSGESIATISGDTCMLQKSSYNGGNTAFITDEPPTLKQEFSSMVGANPSMSNCYPLYNTFTSEQNPDLISDTALDRKFAVASSTASIEIPPSTSMYHQVQQQKSCIADMDDPLYSSIPPVHMSSTAAWTTSSINIPVSNGVHSLPLNICFSSPHPVPVAPEQLMITTFPGDFGLPPKMATHFPTVLPTTAYYRTLPHKRHMTGASNAGSKCLPKYARDAELLTRSTQPAPFEHFHTADVRYNIEGYPKDSPVYTFVPHVSFSDTVEVLGRSPQPQIERCKGAGNVDEFKGTVQSGHHEVTTAAKSAKLAEGLKIASNDSPDEGYVGENTSDNVSEV